MTQNSTRERVRAIIAKATGKTHAEISDSTPLFYDSQTETHGAALARGSIGLDSLDRVEVMMDVEDEFDIKVPDADVQNPESWVTIDAIVTYLESRLAADYAGDAA